jgi:hypothetical protein
MYNTIINRISVGISKCVLASSNETRNATNSPRIPVQIHNQIFRCLTRIPLGEIGHRKTFVYVGRRNTEEDIYMPPTRFETQIVDFERPLGNLVWL